MHSGKIDWMTIQQFELSGLHLRLCLGSGNLVCNTTMKEIDLY